MTRYTINEPAFRRLVRGERIIVPGGAEVELSPKCRWDRMLRAILDTIAPDDRPPGVPKGPPDPPQAREFLPNQYTRRPVDER